MVVRLESSDPRAMRWLAFMVALGAGGGTRSRSASATGAAPAPTSNGLSSDDPSRITSSADLEVAWLDAPT
jgi:hypothetical protein